MKPLEIEGPFALDRRKEMIEWAGCITGLLGALVLALNQPWAGWGWALFLCSNALWISYGYMTQARGMVIMQIGFSITSVIGIMNTLLK